MSQIWDWLPTTAWDWLSKTNPDVWSAVAAWLTLVVAVIASIAALKQVAEARKTREDQAQPYVAAYMDQSEVSASIIDLVIKNFGTTAARDVRISSSPPLRRTTHGQESEEVQLFESIPFLAPGQEWRTFWDSGISRAENSALEKRYEVTIHYKDARRRQMDPTEAILDWAVHDGRQYVEIYGLHHAAKALREMDKTIKKWGDGNRGLAVYARDGDKKDERNRDQREEMRRRLQELSQRTKPVQAEMQSGDVSAPPPFGQSTPGAGDDKP